MWSSLAPLALADQLHYGMVPGICPRVLFTLLVAKLPPLVIPLVFRAGSPLMMFPA
jgi:hypothetical protein